MINKKTQMQWSYRKFQDKGLVMTIEGIYTPTHLT
jgi:hypothetical protein